MCMFALFSCFLLSAPVMEDGVEVPVGGKRVGRMLLAMETSFLDNRFAFLASHAQSAAITLAFLLTFVALFLARTVWEATDATHRLERSPKTPTHGRKGSLDSKIIAVEDEEPISRRLRSATKPAVCAR